MRAHLGKPTDEAWNTTFGSDSLYEAWTQLPFVHDIYAHNRAVIAGTLQERTDWHVVEVGGGNGALWDGLLDALAPGTFTLIDPNPNAHDVVGRRLPATVDFRPVIADVKDATIPDADVIVCSLTLHHHPGRDAAQRAEFGMKGDGKLEIAQRFVEALRPRNGIGILNEADCYNEIDLGPGDEVLVDHFLDVYVRRTARAVARAIDDAPPDSTLRRRWEAILRQWCLDQIDYAYAPRKARDVYELDAASWLRLLRSAGATHTEHRYSDQWNLFVQYLFR
ncbi:class I SAM-dependent methyltransferase [Mycolicibacterium mengxianglii]|uniref:class I SAM-dependent methyltransferase n=1 Tax=Mycolicibacterium mengxianglii TaxID=2736649 RepID=UPI001E35EC07|nr:class I SAM-dependent methyltransferase [Mycolicibacterium mengxianglii]